VGEAALVLALPPALQRLHPVVGGGGARAATGVQVQVAGVHRVLPTVAVEYLSIVLVVFAVVGPPEAGAQAKVRQLDVPIRV